VGPLPRPLVADGDGLQIWRVAANVLNKHWRTADKGWSPYCGLGGGLTTPQSKKKKKTARYEMLYRTLDSDVYFETKMDLREMGCGLN
jgi:hypothetical protein